MYVLFIKEFRIYLFKSIIIFLKYFLNKILIIDAFAGRGDAGRYTRQWGLYKN